MNLFIYTEREELKVSCIAMRILIIYEPVPRITKLLFYFGREQLGYN